MIAMVKLTRTHKSYATMGYYVTAPKHAQMAHAKQATLQIVQPLIHLAHKGFATKRQGDVAHD